MHDKIVQVLNASEFVPAAGQGVIAVECLSDNYVLRSLLQKINCPITEVCLTAERDMCRALQATCQSPVAAHARCENNLITLEGLVASPDGSIIKRVTAVTIAQEFNQLGLEVAKKLIQQGAMEIIRLAKEQILSSVTA